MRLAVISPFLDRRHGTERCVVEQLERFPKGADNEIHIYAQRLEDLRGSVPYTAGKKSRRESADKQMFWHRVPAIPGPHLLQYIFWFYANKLLRRRDARDGLKCDLLYSPGINAADADAIAVHMVFHEFHQQIISELAFRNTVIKEWPRLIHRRLYYRLIMALEKKVYTNPGIGLAAVSGLVAQQLERYFQRHDVRVIHHGVDTEKFSMAGRVDRTCASRKKFGLSAADFVILFVGNDWKIKGLDALLRALASLQEFPWKLLVVGSDVRVGYQHTAEEYGISKRVSFLPPSPDVLQFYSAADAYAGPSLEDSYGLPVLEAMACGLPVIASSRAGVSEIIISGENGIVLRDPKDVREISTALKSLMESPALCRALGERASVTARNETWDRNAAATWRWLNEVLRIKNALQSAPRRTQQHGPAGS